MQRQRRMDKLRESQATRQLLKDTATQFGNIIAETPEEQRGPYIDSAMRIFEGQLGVKFSPLMKQLFKEDPLKFFENLNYVADNSPPGSMSMKTLRQMTSNEAMLMPFIHGLTKARQRDDFQRIATGAEDRVEGRLPPGTPVPQPQPAAGSAAEPTLRETIGGGSAPAFSVNAGGVQVDLTQDDVSGKAPTQAATGSDSVPDGTNDGVPVQVPTIVKGQVRREQAIGQQISILEGRMEQLVNRGGAGSKEAEFLQKRIDAARADMDRMTSNELRAMISATGGDPSNPTPDAIIRAQKALIQYKGDTAFAESYGRESGQIEAEYKKPLPLAFAAEQRLRPGTTLQDLIDAQTARQQSSAPAASSAPTATTASGAPAGGAGSINLPGPTPGAGSGRQLMTSGELAREKEELGGIGKVAAQQFADYNKHGDAASAELANLQVLQRLIPALNTGALVGPAQEAFYNIAQGYGYNSKTQGALQVFESVTADLVSNMTKRLQGALSDKDVKFLLQIPPSIYKSPDANKVLVSMAIKGAERSIYVQQRAQEWVDQFGSLSARSPVTGENFNQTLKKYRDANPLFSAEMLNPVMTGAGKPASGGGAAAAPERRGAPSQYSSGRIRVPGGVPQNTVGGGTR